jgi:hypothetical protein
MPLVTIDLLAGPTNQDLRLIGDSVHEAMVEYLNVPQRDRFQVVTEHSGDPAGTVALAGPWRPYPAAGSGRARASAARPTCRIESRTACAAAAAWSVRPLISVMACSSAAVRATRSR